MALAFGIIISAMIYMFGSISGTHINPSVIIVLMIGELTIKKEISAQILGAVLASELLKLMFLYQH
ncbi:aquaporin [Kordia sp.]|uniref:aquaporin n=1 Tax=Kordia sp. TaxID=1965332 RepID=UPI003D6B667F